MTSNELEIFKQSILDDVRVMMQTTGQVTQYIGARYVPLFADPLEWSNTKEYEPLTIVLHQGNSYTSRQFVPSGVDISNTEFWAVTGNYNAQIEQYRQEVAAYNNRISVIEDNYLPSVKNQTGLKSVDIADGRQILCDGALFTISSKSDSTRYNVNLNNGNYAVYTPINGVADMTVMGASTEQECSAEINKAFDFKGYNHFYFPEGVYPVSSTILLKRDYVTVEGSIAPSPTSGVSDTCKGSVIKWVGSGDANSAVMLINPKGSFTIETNFPSRGVVVERLSFDGNQLAGYGLFIPFMAYSGMIDKIYAQGCVSAGITIAQSWLVNNGELTAWYNGIGIMLGVDNNGDNHSIFQTNFSKLDGHNSTVMAGAESISNLRGTGVVIRKQGASHIALVDAERNATCGIDVDAFQGLVIDSIWCEFNTSLSSDGIAMKSTGSLNIGTFILSGKDKIINNGLLRIDSIASDTSYYPFEGSANNSISVGTCKYELRKDQDLSTWKALIIEYVEHAVFRGLHTNADSYGNYFTIPNGVPSSIVIVPLETKTCEQFSIGLGKQSLSVPAADWNVGNQFIMPNYNSEHGIIDPFTQLYFSATSSADLKVDIHIMSVKYFTDMLPYQMPRKNA